MKLEYVASVSPFIKKTRLKVVAYIAVKRRAQLQAPSDYKSKASPRSPNISYSILSENYEDSRPIKLFNDS
jgi:hypothetical protein